MTRRPVPAPTRPWWSGCDTLAEALLTPGMVPPSGAWLGRLEAPQANSARVLASFEWRGRTYYATGKSGVNRATGAQVREFEAHDDRVWVAEDGRLFAE